MLERYEVVFAFNKKYLKALEKTNKINILVLQQRVYDLMNLLRVQLNTRICYYFQKEFDQYVNESGDIRSIDFEEDIVFWSYPENVYNIDPKQAGPIYTDSNTVIAKYNIYLVKINDKVFKNLSQIKILSIIRQSIIDILKDYNDTTLASDLFELDIDEFDNIKSIFKFIIRII